jgi:hypothetical protein
MDDQSNRNINYLDFIVQQYNLAKTLAKDLALENQETNDQCNDRYYFECGFAAGLNYRNYNDQNQNNNAGV